MIGLLYNKYKQASRCSINFEYMYTKSGLPRATICSIHIRFRISTTIRSYMETAMIHGLAFCNPEDVLTKKRGKELALARAVEKMPKYVQAQIWRIYRGK